MRAAATNPRAAGWRIVYWSGIKARIRTVTQSCEPLSDANWSNLRPSAAALVSHSRPSVIKWHLSAAIYRGHSVDCCTYTVSRKRKTPNSVVDLTELWTWVWCLNSVKVLWHDVHVYRCTCVYLFHLPWLMSLHYLVTHESRKLRFHLNVARCFTNKHVKCDQINTWLQLNHALLLVRYLSNSVKCYMSSNTPWMRSFSFSNTAHGACSIVQLLQCKT